MILFHTNFLPPPPFSNQWELQLLFDQPVHSIVMDKGYPASCQNCCARICNFVFKILDEQISFYINDSITIYIFTKWVDLLFIQQMLKKFNKLIKDHSTSNDIRRSVGVGNTEGLKSITKDHEPQTFNILNPYHLKSP